MLARLSESGGASLPGVPSILEAKPGKRFATIVAQNACAVQKLASQNGLGVQAIPTVSPKALNYIKLKIQ